MAIQIGRITQKTTQITTQKILDMTAANSCTINLAKQTAQPSLEHLVMAASRSDPKAR